MRALALAATSLHVAAVLALVMAIAFEAPFRIIASFIVAVVITIGWTIWLFRQDEEAELRRPPVPPPAPPLPTARMVVR